MRLMGHTAVHVSTTIISRGTKSENIQTKHLSFGFLKAIDGKAFPHSCLTGFKLLAMYHSSATRSAFNIDPFVKGIS